MATKKLSVALKALLTPEFGAKVEMPSISLNGTLVTSSAAELNFVDGVTSNVQTQLNAKAASSHNHAGTEITSGVIGVSRLPAYTSGAGGIVPDPVTATGSQVLADDGWKKINNLYSAFTLLTDGATVTWNMATDSYNARVTLGGSRVLNITNVQNGMSGCLKITQDGTGGWALELPASSYFVNGGDAGYALSSAPGSIDILTFIYDGTRFLWSIGNNYTLMLV